jgi:hypothetical protein
MRAFVASLLVSFVALSVLADSGRAARRVMTGTVTEWHGDTLIRVANEQTGPRGVEIALRETVYDGDPTDIAPGVRVTVWYRSVGERRFIADKVRVLLDATHSPGG